MKKWRLREFWWLAQVRRKVRSWFCPSSLDRLTPHSVSSLLPTGLPLLQHFLKHLSWNKLTHFKKLQTSPERGFPLVSRGIQACWLEQPEFVFLIRLRQFSSEMWDLGAVKKADKDWTLISWAVTSVDFSQWRVRSTDTGTSLEKRDNRLLPLTMTFVLSPSIVPEGLGAKFREEVP